MNWDNLEINDWIDMEEGFLFYVESYLGDELVSSECFASVKFAKQEMEYIKLHRKDITQVHIIAVKNTLESIQDLQKYDEYWADVDSWIRGEVK